MATLTNSGPDTSPAPVHPLRESIAVVRRGARRLRLFYGIGWSIVCLTALVLAMSGLDYYLRSDYRPARVILSLAALLISGLVAWRFLWPSLKDRDSDVALAQRVQSRFAGMEDRVASAIQFLAQRDDSPTAGSLMLRRAVIVDATVALQDVDLDEVLDRRPARRALVVCFCAVAIATGVALLWPAGARIALARLANPFGSTQWPRANHLEFHNPPDRLAAGQVFEVELIDRNGQLPEDVQIQYRFGGTGAQRLQSEPMRPLGDKMVAHREAVRASFQYRATGGDDDTMPWHELQVIEPPRVESLSVTMTPPAYTGWPVEESTGRVAALVGTRLEFRGTASKPLAAVALRTEGGIAVAGRIDADGQSFVVPADGAEPMLLKTTGNYWFEMTDRQEIVAGGDQRWQMRAVPDEPPSVTLEKPAADQYVTSEAVIGTRVLAKDRLALRSMALRYNRSDRSSEGDHDITLYQGPQRVASTDRQGMATAVDDGERRIVERDFTLAELRLKPGTVLQLLAVATDYQPAQGQSAPVKITIITPRELEERLARQQAVILGELTKALEGQRRARLQGIDLEIQLREVGLNPRDVDQLKALEGGQRDVRQRIASPNESIRGMAEALVEQLKSNRVNSPEVERRMRDLAGLMEQLERDPLAKIERSLTATLKNAQAALERSTATKAPTGQEASPPPRDASAPEQLPPKDGVPETAPRKDQAKTQQSNDTRESRETKVPHERPPATSTKTADERPLEQTKEALRSAIDEQDRVIAALEQAVDELARWDAYRQFARHLGDLQREQQGLTKQSEEMIAKTIGRDLKKLGAQEAADLKKKTEKQLDLARQFEKAAERMRKAAERLNATDPLAAQAIDDALAHAQKKSIAQQMRGAAGDMQRNQVAAATGRQREAGQQLEEMVNILANRREQELSRLVKKLREAEEELGKIHQQQSALRKKMREAAKTADPEKRRREMQRLAREQRDLKERAERLSRQLKRLDAPRAGSRLARAGSNMEAAGASGESGNADQADSDAAQTERDLEDTQRQLAQERRSAEIDLAQEQLLRLKDRLKALKEQQQVLLLEAKRIEQLREEQGRLTRGQLVSVTDLGRSQTDLRDETAHMARKIEAVEVFSQMLERAAAEMSRAADLFSKLETGERPQEAQRRAATRLGMILKALENEKPDNDQEGGGQGPGPAGENQPQQVGDGIHTLSELKLLKLIQEDVLLRTELIEQRKRLGLALAEEEMAELAELAEEQGRLAELMLKLRAPAENRPEDDPDKLPGGESDEEPRPAPQEKADVDGETAAEEEVP